MKLCDRDLGKADDFLGEVHIPLPDEMHASGRRELEVEIAINPALESTSQATQLRLTLISNPDH